MLVARLLCCLCLLGFVRDGALSQTAGAAQQLDPKQLLAEADTKLAAARKTNDPSEIGTALQYRGRALRLSGQMKEASQAFLEAAAIWDKLHQEDGRVSARGAAAIVLAKVEPARSTALVQEALRIAQSNAKDPLSMANALHQVGLTAASMRLPALSATFFNAGIALREKQSPNEEETADLLLSEGQACRSYGDFDQAIHSIRHALAIYEQLGNKERAAYCCYLLGSFALTLGDLPIAELYDRRGIALEEARQPNGQLIRWMLQDRARVLSWRGEYEEAEALLRRVVEMPPLDTIKPPDSTYPEKAYMDLGSVYLESGKVTEGEQALQKAQTLIQQADLSRPKIWHLPQYLLDDRLGDLAMKKGDLATAAAKYEAAYKPFSGYDLLNPVNILILMKLAAANEKLGLHPKADEEITLALKEAGEIAPDSAMMASALFTAAEILYNRHDVPGAEKRYQEAWNLMQRQVDALPGDQARLGSAPSASDYAQPLLRTQIETGHLEAAFLTLEQSRAQTLRKLLAERQLTMARQPSHQMELYRLALTAQNVAVRTLSEAVTAEARARAVLAQQPSAKAAWDAAAKSLAEARKDAAAARAEVDKTWVEVQKNDKRLFAEPIAMQQARQSLPPGTLYIAFSCSQQETTVFLVEGGGSVQTYSLKVEENDFSDRVSAFKKIVSDRTSSEDSIVQQGRVLFQTLFPPEAAAQVGRARHLLISPDGPLWDVPFPALVVNADGPPAYLGLQKPIAFTQSLTVYALMGAAQPPGLAASPGKPLTVAVVGDPVFSPQDNAPTGRQASPSNPPLERAFLWGGKMPPSRLPGTRSEATRIAALYKGIALLGDEATEAALRARLANADVIHLATHGFTNPSHPLASGILLTPPISRAAGKNASNSQDDGALQASEIFSEIQLKADLAVLSACETGVGRKVHGEGVIGLTRALQYAGVRSIVASQWKVADTGTGDLMMAFHQKVLAGTAKDEALWGAMQAVQSQPKTSHPSYWAAFFLTGDAGPLRPKGPSTDGSSRQSK